MAKIFLSYSHADETYCNLLQKHLAALKHQGLIEMWHDRRIKPGDEFENAIDQQLNEAEIILLLVSSDFIASRYCYQVEMMRALERHEAGEARAIPIILRPCDWHDTPFGKLQAAPKDARPVKSWPDIDEAYLDIVRQIKAVLSGPRGEGRANYGYSGNREGSTRTSSRSPAIRQPDSSKGVHRSGQGRLSGRRIHLYGGVFREFTYRNGRPQSVAIDPVSQN